MSANGSRKIPFGEKRKIRQMLGYVRARTAATRWA